MSNKVITTNSAEETQEFGEQFASQILEKKPGKKALVLALQGDLGAGKTTFIQGFSKGLGIKEKILSPTFILMKKFKIQNPKFQINPKSKIQKSKFTHFYHIDCYRLKNGKDLEVLDFKEIISNPENIVAIEWPEKVKKLLPKKMVLIRFNHSIEDQRKLVIGSLSSIIEKWQKKGN